MLSTTHVNSEDLSHEHSHQNPSPQVNYQPNPSPFGSNPNNDPSTYKTKPIASILMSPYLKPPRKIGPPSPPHNSLHQINAQTENISPPSNIISNSSVKRKSTNSYPSDLLAKKTPNSPNLPKPPILKVLSLPSATMTNLLEYPNPSILKVLCLPSSIMMAPLKDLWYLKSMEKLGQ